MRSIDGKRIKQINNIEIKDMGDGTFIALAPDGVVLERGIDLRGMEERCKSCTKYLKRGIPKEEYVKRIKEEERKKDRELCEIRRKVIDEISRGNSLLFHGSVGGIQGKIDCRYSANVCDFGSGFYTGDNLKQAENRVANKKDGIVYAYRFESSRCKIYRFTDDVLWILFIGYNRKIHGLDVRGYKRLIEEIRSIELNDVIVGKIADDKISSIYTEFITGSVTDRCLIECLKLVNYGEQYVFKNNETIGSSLREIYKYSLSKQMRVDSVEWNKGLKKSMESDMSKIKVQYRRVGRFIDECMEDYR